MDEQYTIVHIADVHWRGGIDRHAEYKQIFQDFFDKVSQIKPDVIHVGGDIFHTKTQNISPEVLECLDWWFTGLADIAEVVVTLGNHDGNLMNKNRQDSITPIVKLLDNPRIKLYKQSGVYQSSCHGVNWCVFSCFDDEETWVKQVKPVAGDVNIALFHGSVVGSKSSTDFALKGDVDVSFFGDFDFALLGDIHKMQFLGYRDCVDGQRRPWIGYCGSTIQQNYAESHDHGFLVWRIRSRDDFDVEFVKLHNSNEFVTLNWAGDVDSTVDLARAHSNGARFRIRSGGDIGHAEWRRLVRTLKRDHNAREVVPKVDLSLDEDSESRKTIVDLAHDIRDPKTICQLVHDYHADIDPVEWSKIEELIIKYVKNISSTEMLARNVHWSLDQLDFSNTFAYGEDNVIDFTRLNGITGIFAGNAMGKSSIIGTIMYALFNATDRGSMKNLHVINDRKDYCEATANITINDVKHRITRSSRRMQTKKGHEHAITSLDFTCVDTDMSLNGEQRSDTEKKIRATIGSADDFTMTSLAIQGGLKAFINEGATQRKAILSRFLDLQVFDFIHELAKQDSIIIKAKIKDMPERDWDITRAQLQEKTDDNRTTLDDLEHQISSARASLSEKKMCLSALTGNDRIIVTQDDVEKKRRLVKELIDRQASLNDVAVKLQRSYDSLMHRIELIKRVKSSFPLQAALNDEKARNDLRSWISDVERHLDQALDKCAQHEKSVTKLSTVPCGDKFPSCRYIRDSHNDKKNLPEVKALVDELKNSLADGRLKLASLENSDQQKKFERYKRIVAREADYNLQLAKIKHDVAINEHAVDSNSSLLDKERGHLEELKSQLNDVDTTVEHRRLSDDISDIENSISMMDHERIDVAQRLGKLAALREQLDVEWNLYQELTAEWRAYEKLISAMSRRGIPSQLLKRLIPAINDEIASILNGIVDFTVQLDVPDDASSNAMEVFIDYGDNRRIIELGSGMEKMVASIAIRVALINISSLPKTDMLIIDEGFSELDENNIDACGNLLRSLTRLFKNIIIITHIDTLKDVVDNVIDIARVDKDAKVMLS